MEPAPPLRRMTYPYASFIIPTAAAAALVAVWPAWTLLALTRDRARRRRRLARGCCPACGYDLRGAGDACPECGAARPRPAARGRLPATLAALAACVTVATSREQALASPDSIETAVAKSDVVVVATLAEFIEETGRGSMRGARARLRVVEVLKGEAPQSLPIYVPAFHRWAFDVWEFRSGERLVLLVKPGRREPWEDASYPLELRPGDWAVTTGDQNERRPTRWTRSDSPVAFTMDLRVLYTQADAITAAREALRWPAPPGGFGLIDVPPASEMGHWFRGNSARLWVPLDDRMEAIAHRWADDPAYAMAVVRALSHFPSDRNAAVLARLLDDQAAVVEGVRHGKAMGWRHPAREAAATVLSQWGRLDRPVRTRGPRDFYVPVGRVHFLGAAAVALAVACAAVVVARRGRRVPLVAMLMLAALGSAAWHLAVADRFVHEVTWTLGSSRYWVSAYGEGIQFVRIGNWPERPPLSFARLDLAQAPESLWTEEDLLVSKATQFAGFRSIVGSAWGPEPGGGTYPYASFTAPIAVVVALLAAWPAWLAWGWARRRARRRDWIAQGCCGECGYGLTGAGDRCPECGAPRPAIGT